MIKKIFNKIYLWIYHRFTDKTYYAEMLYIASGYSGIGKTSLLEEK